MKKLWIAPLGILALAGGARAGADRVRDARRPPAEQLRQPRRRADQRRGLRRPPHRRGRRGSADQGFACSSECRVLCADVDGGAAARCPDGWGCGVDGLCRPPDGRVHLGAGRARRERQPPAPRRPRRRRPQGHRGRQPASTCASTTSTGQGALSETASINTEDATPALGDFDGDGITDLAYRLESAVTVRLGSSDRALTAVPVPAALADDAPRHERPAGRAPPRHRRAGHRPVDLQAARAAPRRERQDHHLLRVPHEHAGGTTLVGVGTSVSPRE